MVMVNLVVDEDTLVLVNLVAIEEIPQWVILVAMPLMAVAMVLEVLEDLVAVE